MAYNPILDLVIGLFLLLVPFFLFGVLAYLLVAQGSKPKSPGPSNRGSEDWGGWVRRTLDQAREWRSRLDEPPPEEGGAETDDGDRRRSEKLAQIIGLLESMKNGRPERQVPESTED